MKFINKQPPEQQKRIFRSIYLLPVVGDVKKLSGSDTKFRLRVGNYRIIFEVVPESNEVTLVDVTDAGNRGQVYNNL